MMLYICVQFHENWLNVKLQREYKNIEQMTIYNIQKASTPSYLLKLYFLCWNKLN